MKRKQRVQFMLDSGADESRLDALDVPVSTRELPNGNVLVESTEAFPAEQAQEIERTIRALFDSHTDR